MVGRDRVLIFAVLVILGVGASARDGLGLCGAPGGASGPLSSGRWRHGIVVFASVVFIVTRGTLGVALGRFASLTSLACRAGNRTGRAIGGGVGTGSTASGGDTGGGGTGGRDIGSRSSLSLICYLLLVLLLYVPKALPSKMEEVLSDWFIRNRNRKKEKERLTDTCHLAIIKCSLK